MKRLLLLCLLLPACGEYCEQEIAGACFNGNGWYWNVDMVNITFDATQAAFSKFYCRKGCVKKVETNLDLRALAAERNLKVSFSDYLSASDCSAFYSCEGYYDGSDSIKITKSQYTRYNWPNAHGFYNCRSDYHYLGHELLHFIAHRFLDKRSSDHSIPFLFFATTHIAGGLDVAEGWIYDKVESACAMYYGIGEL